MTLTTDISNHFDHHAPNYDNFLTSYIGERELRLIRPLIPPQSTVLDFGCGTGRTTIDLLKRGCRVTAFDISHEMISLAINRATRLGFSAEFTTSIDQLSGRTWPVVTCIGVLDYYPDPAPLLRQLCTYLEPNGRLVVTVPNAKSLLGWLYGLGSRLRLRVTPQSAANLRAAADRASIQVNSLAYAFPTYRPLALTLVVELSVPAQAAG